MTDMETLMRQRLDGFFYTVSASGCLGCRVVDLDWMPDYGKMIQSPHPSALLSDEERRFKFHRQWTAEEDESLLAMAKAGKSTREMSKALERSIEAVQKRRNILNCSLRETGGSRPTTKADKFYWTDDMRAEATRLRKMGHTIPEIAERFGCNYRSVTHALEYVKRNLWREAA